MPADNRYAFLVEWLDPQAQLVRQYLLFFYSLDGTVEMVRPPGNPVCRVRACVRACVSARLCVHASKCACRCRPCSSRARASVCTLPLACEGCASPRRAGVNARHRVLQLLC